MSKFLPISNIFFLLLIIVLAWNNQLAVDDFYFYDNAVEFGVFKATLKEYSTWNSRFLPVFFTHFVFKLISINKISLFLYHLLQFSALIIVSKYTLSKVFKRLNVNQTPKWSYAILLSGIVFYLTPDISGTWFWITTSTMYSWSLIFGILLIGILLKENKSTIDYSFVFLLMLYVSNSSAATALTTVFVTFLYSVYTKKVSMLSFVVITACITGFLILNLGQGSINRKAALRGVSFLPAIWINVKATIKIIVLKYSYKIPLIIPFLFLIFNELKNKIDVQLKNIFSKKNVAVSVFSWLILFFVFHLPIAYTMGEMGPYRSLFPITLPSLMFSIIIVGNLYFHYQKLSKLVVFSVLISFSILVYQGYITSKYALAYKEREKRIINGDTELILLPSSGFLFTAEISGNQNHFSNQFLKNHYKLSSAPISK